MATIKNTFMSAASTPGLLADTWVVNNGAAVAGMLAKLRPKKVGKSVLGLDTETVGTDPLMPPARLRLVTFYNGSFVVVFDVDGLGLRARDELARFIEDPRNVKVAHNAKFDIKFLVHCLGVGEVGPLYDTMLADQLLYLGLEYEQDGEGKFHRVKHDLATVVEKELGETLSKDVSHDWGGPLTQHQLVYAANDPVKLLGVREAQLTRAKELGLLRAFKIEFEATQPTAQQELNGFLLDRPKWVRLYKDTQARCKEVEEKLYDYLEDALPPGKGDNLALFPRARRFNLDSAEELKPRLKAVGVTLPTLLDKDTNEIKDTTQMEKMAQIAHLHPTIKLVIEHRKLRKAITSYGEKFLRWVNPHDGRCHADVKQIGTVTTRNAVKEPPLHGIPKQSDHRECFVAAPGRKLVWADYSQIELRILAERSGDQNMLKAFVEGHDLHRFTASLVFGVPLDAVIDIQRRRAKDLNFGIVFGVGPERFAEKGGISVDEAKKLMAGFARAYPQLDTYLKNAAAHARMFSECTTGSGKLIRFRFDPKNGAAVGAVERHGKNYPIQGTSADITKTAERLVHDELRRLRAEAGTAHWPVMLVHVIHDEIVLEADDAFVDEAKAILVDCMTRAGEQFLQTVPVVVDVDSNTFWKKAKDD